MPRAARADLQAARTFNKAGKTKHAAEEELGVDAEVRPRRRNCAFGAPLARLGLVFFLAGLGWSSLAAASEKPYVLFIAVDDLNDWVGALGGHPAVRTPNIDRLASRGLLFTRTYSAAPSCNPSRTALLTGIRPSTSGVYGNGQPMRDSLPDAVTLPQHFMANGYTAVRACFVRIFTPPNPLFMKEQLAEKSVQYATLWDNLIESLLYGQPSRRRRTAEELDTSVQVKFEPDS